MSPTCGTSAGGQSCASGTPSLPGAAALSLEARAAVHQGSGEAGIRLVREGCGTRWQPDERADHDSLIVSGVH